MTVDAWPDDLPHGIVEFDLVGGSRSGGAFGDLPPATEPSPLGGHWRASVSQIFLRTKAQLLAGRAAEGFLDGGAGVILVPACDGSLRPQAPGGAAITAEFDADYPLGTTDVTLNLGGGYLQLRGGEHASVDHPDVLVGRRMYEAVQILGGTAASPQVRLSPPLRQAVEAGDALDFVAPSCPMRLESGFDISIEDQRRAGVEATFVENFDGLEILQLRALVLAPHTILSGSAEDTFVGFLLNTTATSAITLTDSAGSRFKLVDGGDGTWSIVAGSVATDHDVATSHHITVRETLAGYPNSPRDTTLTIQVTEPEATSMVLTITNPGFETGDLTGWTTSDPSCTPLNVIAHSGVYSLYGGNVGATTAYQIGDGDVGDPYFDVSAFASRIDTGHVVLQNWESWRNETTNQGDTGRMEVWFYDGAGAFISEAHVSGLNFPVGWQHLVQGDLAVPVGTRRIKLGCSNTRAVGPALQNFFDDFASTVTLQYNP
jgi:hypothetical protein